MNPKSEIKHSAKDLHILKRTIRNTMETKRNIEKIAGYATPLPESVGIKLTNQCNLRCKHCYQWNDTGYHHFHDTGAAAGTARLRAAGEADP